MRFDARVLVAITVAACHRAPEGRERALDRLPGAAQLVAAADGPALAEPTLRRAIDAARPRVADSLGCVIDAALAGDAVAIAATRTTGATIVIATHATPECPALSRIEDDLWVATVGDGGIAPAPEASVLAVSRWARARGYLLDAPLALALDLGGPHVVAAARAQPFEGWLAIDAAPPAAAELERSLLALLESWRAGSGSALAGKLVVTRVDDQLVVRADRLDGDDVSALAPAVLDAIDPPPLHAYDVPHFDCPARGIVQCIDATHFTVASVPDALVDMLWVPTKPIVASGSVIGVELQVDSALLLRRGDIVLGIDNRPVRDARDLEIQVKDVPRSRVAVAIRRRGIDAVIVLNRAIE